jgi:hypothetical protein
MNNTKVKNQQTIFTLIKVEYDFEHDNKTLDPIPVQYPEFEVSKFTMGLFSTLAKAEQTMKAHVEGDKCYIDDVFCYLINEHRLDECSWGWNETSRSYLPDGSLLEECLLSELPDDDGGYDEFLGRPSDKIPYKVGELVEVLQGNKVFLSIVGGCPYTPEETDELKKKHINYRSDYMDDSYYTFSVCEDDDHDTHEHPRSTQMFPLRFAVSDELKQNLERQYRKLL